MYLFGYCLEVNLLLVRKVDQIQFCRLPYHVKCKVVQIQFFEALSTIGLPWLSSFYKVWECSWRFQCPPEVSFYFCRLRKVQEVSVKFSPSWLSLVGGYCSLRAWGNEPRLWSGDGSLLFLAAWCRKSWVPRRGFLGYFRSFWMRVELAVQFCSSLIALVFVCGCAIGRPGEFGQTLPTWVFRGNQKFGNFWSISILVLLYQILIYANMEEISKFLRNHPFLSLTKFGLARY